MRNVRCIGVYGRRFDGVRDWQGVDLFRNRYACVKLAIYEKKYENSLDFFQRGDGSANPGVQYPFFRAHLKSEDIAHHNKAISAKKLWMHRNDYRNVFLTSHVHFKYFFHLRHLEKAQFRITRQQTKLCNFQQNNK